jgi:hypothetical protein
MNYPMSSFIVQYVGFKTLIDKDAFRVRWVPFASQFKSMGIKTIDLYAVLQPNDIQFISRNVWDTQAYLKSFPSGVADSGGGGGIMVVQFGAYWLKANQLERDNEMELVFLNTVNTIVEVPDNVVISRLRVTDTVRFRQLLDFPTGTKVAVPDSAVALICKHLQRM